MPCPALVLVLAVFVNLEALHGLAIWPIDREPLRSRVAIWVRLELLPKAIDSPTLCLLVEIVDEVRYQGGAGWASDIYPDTLNPGEASPPGNVFGYLKVDRETARCQANLKLFERCPALRLGDLRSSTCFDGDLGNSRTSAPA